MLSQTAQLAGRLLLRSRLYAILDPAQTKGRPANSILRALLDGGSALIQLRAKEMAAKEFFRLASEARELTLRQGSLLIINDRVDIALATRADGVHVGQEDLPLRAARKLMRNKIIGVSTHSLSQAQEAERDGASYIGFGPIFGTATKETGYAPRGLAMLREIRRAVKIPVVAIGGIKEDNVTQVWEAGADAAAIISDIMEARDVAEKVRRILAKKGRTEV